MRKLFGILASGALILGGLIGVAPSAQAAQPAPAAPSAECTLALSDYIYNGANTLMYSAKMIGCSADVYVEIQSGPAETGPFTVDESGTQHLTEELEATWFDGNCLQLWVRVYMKYGDQEDWTHPAINSNAGGNCG